MAEAESKTPARTEQKTPAETSPQVWQPFATLQREVERLFDTFGRDLWRPPFNRSAFDVAPFWRRDLQFATPAVDIVDKDNAYEITADLPGLDEKDIEVQVVNGNLTIKGEKHEEKEEKRKDYFLQERHFGSFQRSFGIPEGVDADKIEASFKKGVLTVTLPKKTEAQKPVKKIDVKSA